MTPQMWTLLGVLAVALGGVFGARVAARASITAAENSAYTRAQSIYNGSIDELVQRIERIKSDHADQLNRLEAQLQNQGDRIQELESSRRQDHVLIRQLQEHAAQQREYIHDLLGLLRQHRIQPPPTPEWAAPS